MTDTYVSSYPVTEAANAVGVDIGMAARYVWANRLYCQSLAVEDVRRLNAAYREIEEAYGTQTVTALQERLETAIMDGRIYWPIPNWATWPMLIPARVIPGRIEDDDDSDVPPQPEPLP